MKACRTCKYPVSIQELAISKTISRGNTNDICPECALEYPPAGVGKKIWYTMFFGDDQYMESEKVKAFNQAGAEYLAKVRTEKWLKSCDWVTDKGVGFEVEGKWELHAGLIQKKTVPIASGKIVHVVPHNHELLILHSGGNPECKHYWISTIEIEGGCKENPGYWSTGGTTTVQVSHCLKCNVSKKETKFGAQRNPGQMDLVEYRVLRHDIDPNTSSQLDSLFNCGHLPSRFLDPEYVGSLGISELEAVIEKHLRPTVVAMWHHSTAYLPSSAGIAKYLKNRSL